MSAPNLYARIEMLSPEKATEYLAFNTNNRPPRRRHIDALATAMLNGEWRLTHQGIAFNCDGTLKDGQHRLMAIAQSGVTVPMLVTRGLPADAMRVIDTHAVRPPHEALNLEGHNFTKKAVAIARYIGCDNYNGRYDAAALTRGQVLGLLERHEEAIVFASRVTHRGVSSAPVLAPVARAFYTQDRGRLNEYLDILSTGLSNGPCDSAAVALRNSIQREGDKLQSLAGRTSAYRRSSAALRAFLERRYLTRIYEAESELFPSPYCPFIVS